MSDFAYCNGREQRARSEREFLEADRETVTLAASRGAFMACTRPGVGVAEAARALGYERHTPERRAFERGHEWGLLWKQAGAPW